LKLLKPGSFDVHKNAVVPIIIILGHLELDIEVLGTGMETVESNDYRRMPRKDRDANGMLAVMQEGARFFHKDGWKFIDPFTQSISKLCWMS